MCRFFPSTPNPTSPDPDTLKVQMFIFEAFICLERGHVIMKHLFGATALLCTLGLNCSYEHVRQNSEIMRIYACACALGVSETRGR